MARLDALTYPHLFLRQLLVEFAVGLGLGFELLVTKYEEATVVVLPQAQHAAVKFENAVGHGLQERAIVGDDHHSAAVVLQLFFEPLNGRDVEVVGGFVE